MNYKSYLIIFIFLFIIENHVPQTFQNFGNISKIHQAITNKNILINKHERTISSDASQFFNCVEDILLSPSHWNNNDLLTAGGILAFSAGSFFADKDVRKIFLKNQNKTLDKIEPIGYSYGSPVYTIPGSLLFYSAGAVFDNNWIRDTGLMLTETLVVIGIIQIPSRIIFGRSRPYTEEGNLSFKFLKGLGQDRASFISGHAAIAFGISNILAHQIDHPAATIGLFGLASITPLSRLYADKHWFSDIVIGTALGMVISNAVINFNDKDKNSGNRFSISPSYNGINFTYMIN